MTAPAPRAPGSESDRGIRARRPRGTAVLISLYLVLAVAGLVGTWYFNLQFTAGGNGQGYLQAWFANSASSSAAVDVIVTALVASVFYTVEGFRLRMRWTLVLVPLTFLVARSRCSWRCGSSGSPARTRGEARATAHAPPLATLRRVGPAALSGVSASGRRRSWGRWPRRAGPG